MVSQHPFLSTSMSSWDVCKAYLMVRRGMSVGYVAEMFNVDPDCLAKTIRKVRQGMERRAGA